MRNVWSALIFSLLGLLLTQCASVKTGSALRESRLRGMGYVPLKLDKLTGDSRYSGVFGVNGKPMRFLIDSGANTTDVESDRADEANLKRDRSVSIVSRGALGRPVKTGLGRGSLQVGPMVASDFPFMISPKTKRRTATSQYAGQVGLNALSATGSLIDIPRASLWVPGPKSRQGRTGDLAPVGALSEVGGEVMPLRTAGRLPHLILVGDVNGRPTTWVVDTGAEVSVMAEESFRNFGLPSYPSNSRIIDASGDRVGLRVARLNEVRFGRVIVKEFEIAVASLKPVRRVFRDANGRPVDGILGMDFLTQSRALLDSGSRVLYMGYP